MTLVYRRGPEPGEGEDGRSEVVQGEPGRARGSEPARGSEREGEGAEARASVRISVIEPSEPTADQWPDWDPVELT